MVRSLWQKAARKLISGECKQIRSKWNSSHKQFNERVMLLHAFVTLLSQYMSSEDHNRVELRVTELEAGTWGQYAYPSGVIRISEGLIHSESPTYVLTTVVHELCHHYQWCWLRDRNSNSRLSWWWIWYLPHWLYMVSPIEMHARLWEWTVSPLWSFTKLLPPVVTLLSVGILLCTIVYRVVRVWY